MTALSGGFSNLFDGEISRATDVTAIKSTRRLRQPMSGGARRT